MGISLIILEILIC